MAAPESRERQQQIQIRLTLTKIFQQLRRRGFQIGIRELLDAVRAIEEGFCVSEPEAMKDVARFIWCYSPTEHYDFDHIWAEFAPQLRQITQPAIGTSKSPDPISLPQPKNPIPDPPKDPFPKFEPPKVGKPEPKPTPAFAAFPIQVPTIDAKHPDAYELQAYAPVSHRQMVYAWRYLHRPVADGMLDVLDVGTTIQVATRQGFFLKPIYKRRVRNHAQILLLADQNGSMVPFHRITRDLVGSIQYESALEEEQIQVMYFYNVVGEYVYRDTHLTNPVQLESILTECSEDTSVLIVSDAGAARGRRVIKRVQSTVEFLVRLRQVSSLLAWLNPVPQPRWESTSAQLIASVVPMFALDPDGLSNAIDVARGQQVYSRQ